MSRRPQYLQRHVARDGILFVIPRRLLMGPRSFHLGTWMRNHSLATHNTRLISQATHDAHDSTSPPLLRLDSSYHEHLVLAAPHALAYNLSPAVTSDVRPGILHPTRLPKTSRLTSIPQLSHACSCWQHLDPKKSVVRRIRQVRPAIQQCNSMSAARDNTTSRPLIHRR